jgi:hypothetical protein
MSYVNYILVENRKTSFLRQNSIMVLPIGRIIAQVLVPLVAVIARALPAAYSQAIQNARRNGVDATQTAANILRREVSKSEALQILNLSESEATAEMVEKVRLIINFFLVNFCVKLIYFPSDVFM